MEYIEALAWMILWLSPLAALASIPAITLGQFLMSRPKKKQQQVRAGNEELAAKSVY